MSARDHRHEQGRAGAAQSEAAATAADGRGSGTQGAVRPHRLDAREEAEAKAMSARKVIAEYFVREAGIGDDPEDRALCVDGSDKLLAHLARHGLAVVPVEPTEKMLDAGLRERQDNDGNVTEIYRAMLAAASEGRDDA